MAGEGENLAEGLWIKCLPKVSVEVNRTMQNQTKYKLLIIGGSAGSFHVIYDMICSLGHLSLPVIIVIHRKDSEQNLLVDLLSVKTGAIVKEVEDKQDILPGYVFVAPPDYHLLVEKNFSMSLDLSAPVNFSRPCIDVSFETAAEVYGETLLALLLSGANSDGARGLLKVMEAGGTTVVQDPATAIVPYMPEKAITLCRPSHIVDGADIPRFMTELISGSSLVNSSPSDCP